MLSNKKSIHKAYTETQQKRKQQAQPEEQTPTSDAMQRAEKAIGQLESIREDDPKRDEAFVHVAKWISDHQKASAPTVDCLQKHDSGPTIENAAPAWTDQYVWCNRREQRIARTICSGCYDTECADHPMC